MSFRIGRKFAQHVYPEARRGGESSAFARNFATGPEESTSIGLAASLPWNAIASGAPSGTEVPITPQVTGIIRVSCMIAFKNNGGDADVALIVVEVNGVAQTIPFTLEQDVPAGSREIVSILAEYEGLTLGVEATVEISVETIAGGLSFVQESCSIEVQEVAAATG